MNCVPVYVETMKHIFNQSKMHGQHRSSGLPPQERNRSSIVRAAAISNVPVPHAGSQILRFHQPVGVRPTTFRYGPVRWHGKFRQQNRSRSACIERPVISSPFVTVDDKAVRHGQAATHECAAHNQARLQSGFEAGCRYDGRWATSVEYSQGGVDDRRVVHFADSLPIIEQRSLFVRSISNF